MLVFKVIENDSVGKRWGYFFIKIQYSPYARHCAYG